MSHAVADHGRPALLSYRALGIGDLLTAVPALRGLRAAFPEHHHVLATSGHLAPLVDMIDAVDTHLPAGELAPLPKWVSPDIGVNLHGRGPQSHRVVLATRPRRLLAVAHPAIAASRDGPPWDPGAHEVTRWCQLLWAHGIAADPADLRLPPPAGTTSPMAVGATLLHPGAKAAARRWPVGRFGEVARREADRGQRVVVTAAPSELRRACAVARMAGLPPEAVLQTPDLGALARAVAAAARLVSGDTGVAHLATALGTPSVTIFGPSSPAQWGPPATERDRHRALWAGLTGDPLADAMHPGLLEISAAEVAEALSALPPAASCHLLDPPSRS